MATSGQSKYLEFKERFSNMSDSELIQAKRQSMSNPGWVSTRAAYELALKNELERRGLVTV